MELTDDIVVTAVVAIFLFLALAAALALTTLARSRPSGAVLGVAAALVVLSLVTVAVLPVRVPTVFGVMLALLGVTLATYGGNPLTRWVLALADGGRSTEGPAGGILVELMGEQPARQEEILRGGTTIGYLERAAVFLGILAGFPAAVAVMVALKGIGRFSELATPAARERFIVGTMASLLWACVVAGVVSLAIW